MSLTTEKIRDANGKEPAASLARIGTHGTATTTNLGTVDEVNDLNVLGYTAELRRNRSMLTLLFQCLAMAAIPFGEGSPLMTAIYGGGQLSIFVGWIVSCSFNQCVGLSLAELASEYPTSAGPYYWSFQVAKRGRTVLSFITGCIWLVGNWTITLSVNFGFASLIAGTVGMYHPDWAFTSWQLLLAFYAITLGTFVMCAFFNRYLPMVDTFCAAWTSISIIIILISLSVSAKAGRHSVKVALTNYDTSLSGWGGFTFFIGLLPPAFCFNGIGLITSMSEEIRDPTVGVPRALALAIPVGFTAGLFFVLPICFTLPPLVDITGAPAGQALPYIFSTVMGSPGGGLGLMSLVLVLTAFCSISVTVAASRCTWAFARDNGLPFGQFFARVHPKHGVPVNAMALLTIVQLLLGLINIGSTSAFTAFVSVGVIMLSVSYTVPITLSLLHGRKEVSRARWHLPSSIGYTVNIISLLWIAFQLILFSAPTVLPVSPVSMNYASVVYVGFMTLSAIWYVVHARKVYKGPPESDGL